MPHTYNTRYQKKVTMEANPLYQQFLTMDFKTLCQQIKFINAQPYWYRDDDVLRYADHALDILRAKNESRNTALMLRFMGVHEEVVASICHEKVPLTCRCGAETIWVEKYIAANAPMVCDECGLRDERGEFAGFA